MSSGLAHLVTRASLAKLAGERSYARGLAYFEQDAVLDLVQRRDDTLKARVLGSEEYRVELRANGRRLEASCTCPVGMDGEFCKHAVAAGLAWLARGKEGGGTAEIDVLETIRAYLGTLSKEALIECLLDQAADDPQLRARLQTSALSVSAPTDTKAQKALVRRAFALPGGYIDYDAMPTFIAQAETIAGLLRGLLDRGQAQQAISLAGEALRQGIAVYENIDDSDGEFGEFLHRLTSLHLEACKAAPLKSEALAAELFALQLLDDWGLFHVDSYAPLLGDQGLARYRALAESAWRAVPELGPGSRREYGGKALRLSLIMEALARLDGDLDALIAVKARDLSQVYAFVEIATLLAEAKRHDEALAWAERGRKAFPKESDRQLSEFLIAAYKRASRRDDAIAVAWEHYSKDLSLAAYKLLRATCGKKAWAAWRDKALSHVRASLKAPRAGNSWHWGERSLLIEIFLDEGDSGAALAEAKAGGCAETLWMSIAAAREAEHPEDAVDIYKARVEPIVQRMNNHAYDEAAALVKKIGGLMRRTGEVEAFNAWVAGLRERHKAKRNLVKRLETWRQDKRQVSDSS